jgi:hypothetical protein
MSKVPLYIYSVFPTLPRGISPSHCLVLARGWQFLMSEVSEDTTPLRITEVTLQSHSQSPWS